MNDPQGTGADDAVTPNTKGIPNMAAPPAELGDMLPEVLRAKGAAIAAFAIENCTNHGASVLSRALRLAEAYAELAAEVE